jgi:hypothetical protein
MQAGNGGQGLASYLPGDGEAPGWSRDGEAQPYDQEGLYGYIDGGAEIYNEYGFRRVIVQDYRDAAGKSVSLEIFEMETPAAAYGMFTFKRSGRGKVVALGSAAELEDYYLNLWRGRFLVTLTGFDATAATIDGLLAVAGRVDKKLGEGSAVPDLVAALPAADLLPQSVKYLRGLLGLNNVYSFYLDRGLGFQAAVKGDYADGTALIVLEYRSEAERAAEWTSLSQALGSSDRFQKAGGDERTGPVFRDRKGRCVAFGQAGSRLAVGFGPDAASAVAAARRAVL